ncbi:MAG: quinolinate synthase [Syntrophobacterales bacterium GWF2_56_9]|nr:MAG: quinolinate synthase [Syntrophobacterales bacterium GWF2_56_9]
MVELVEKIKRLKKDRKAVILAHNYQLPEVQDIADFVGDSLGLSIQAAQTDAAVIVFCGVHFMAETAKLLSPDKTVLLPDKKAGCPMADMITAEQLRALKAEHPGAKVLCYVNTSAEVKAECDLCCTSANAVRMGGEILKDAEEIIFVPDRYLAAFVAGQTGRTFITWPGFCPTHARILPEHVEAARALHPGAVVMVHPECRPEVTALADIAISTGGMIRYAKETKAREIIVGTEPGIIHRLKKENQDKVFHPVSAFVICPNMKRTSLEKILWSLEDMEHAIEVPEEIAGRARLSIEAMLKVGR